MFMVLSSWQNHCESSPGSFGECRTAPSGRQPKTKPADLDWVCLYRLPESTPTIAIYYYYNTCKQEHSESANSAKTVALWLCGDWMSYKIPYHDRAAAASPPDEWLYIVKKFVSLSVKESEKLILQPHPDHNQHRNPTTSIGSPLSHAYHIWSMSVTAFVSYSTHKQNKWHNDRTNDHITPPTLADKKSCFP